MAVQRRVINGINTIVLHGNDYVEVAERFRILHERKFGFEMIESGPMTIGERLLWRVVGKLDGKQYMAHAEIKLSAPKGTPDGSSPFECAETSAWGRLLGMAGLGNITSLASYDEIARSQPFTQITQQPQERIVDERRSIQQSAQSEADKKKARLNSLFKAGRDKGLYGNKEEMALYISDGLQLEITAEGISHLDEVELWTIEQAIANTEGLVVIP
jgi:hypothetical protein